MAVGVWPEGWLGLGRAGPSCRVHAQPASCRATPLLRLQHTALHRHPPPQLGDFEVALGDAVLLTAEDDDEAAPLALVQALWQTADGAPAPWPAPATLRCPAPLSRACTCACACCPRAHGSHTPRRAARARPARPRCCAGEKQVQVRLLARGEATVLGDAASDSEVFLTTRLETR